MSSRGHKASRVLRCTLLLSVLALAAGGQDAPTTQPSTTQPAATRPATTRPVAFAPATLPAETAERFAALMADLNGDAWQARQNAQDTLTQLGPAVGPLIEKALAETTDEEVRTRLEAALRQINQGRLTGTSYITLKMKNASPQQVFAELSRQAATDLRPNPTNLWDSQQWPAADFDIDHQPFWTAMKEVCAKFGVCPQNMGMSREMAIVAGNGDGRMWGRWSCVSGPFLVCATYLHASHSIDLNQPQNVISRNCSLQLMVYPEPKLQVLQGAYNAKLEEAIDKAGNSLINPAMAGMGFQNLQPGRNWAWTLQAYLLPKPDSGEVTRLKASTRFVIQTRSEPGEIPDVMNARSVTRTVAGRKFMLKEARKNGDIYTVQMTLWRSGWSAQEWNFQVGNIFKLVDADGNSLTRQTVNQAGGGADTMDLNLQFIKQNWNGGANPGEPAKLIWDVPIETREVTVPFEFRNLPLP